jgi:hypothetical protein
MNSELGSEARTSHSKIGIVTFNTTKPRKPIPSQTPSQGEGEMVALVAGIEALEDPRVCLEEEAIDILHTNKDDQDWRTEISQFSMLKTFEQKSNRASNSRAQWCHWNDGVNMPPNTSDVFRELRFCYDRTPLSSISNRHNQNYANPQTLWLGERPSSDLEC